MGLSEDEDLEDDGKDWRWMAFWRWIPALLLILSVRTYAFEPYNIPSGSMLPTLEIGDRVVVDKYSYGLWVPASLVSVPFAGVLWTAPRYEIIDWGDPERGDIIVFRYPRDESQTYIKRVVGLPGDRIRVRNNEVIINGVTQSRTAREEGTATDADCHSRAQRRYTERFDSASAGAEHDVYADGRRDGPLADWPSSGADYVVPDEAVFVMGDNRDSSADSRVWGPVRYDQIEGRARAVLFSLDGCGGGVRGERLFRSLYRR